MNFLELNLKNFRNFENLKMEFSPNINIFLGKNGQGKTNLIEALYLITQGSSFRYGDNDILIQKEADKKEATVLAKIINSNLKSNVSLQILKSKKNFLLNSKKTTATNLANNFHVILFSPESLSCIKEADDERRKLVDSLIASSEKSGIEKVYDFKKVQKARNKILKNFAEGHVLEKETQLLLDSINPSYFRAAIELTDLRIQALRAIQPELNTAMKFLCKNKNVDISVDYVISGKSASEYTHQQIKDAMQQRWQDLCKIEMQTGASLVGPHKHDIRFLYNGNDSRFFCSQGQQRSMILSFKIAQIVYHRKIHGSEPVLMLDDVLSELDEDKRSALISFLNGIKTQIFISTTDLNLPEEISKNRVSVFTINDGKVI